MTIAATTSRPEPISVISARPDGATSVALALAARLSETKRTLLVEASLDHPELAPLLDVDESSNLYQIAFQTRMAPISPPELERQVRWRDHLAVLPGAWLDDEQRREITPEVIDLVVSAAVAIFDVVVFDLGRPRPSLPRRVSRGLVLWVVTPSPLGMAALDRTMQQVGGADWLASTRVVFNRTSEQNWTDAGQFIAREYGLEVLGDLPAVPAFWQHLERTHHLAPLCLPAPDPRRFRRSHGDEAWRLRQALDGLIEHLPSAVGREV
jgi:hypothetical protein